MPYDEPVQQVQVSRVFDKIRDAAGPFLTEAQREAILASGQTIPGRRHIVNSGSTRSTKTYSIIQFCIGMALQNPGLQVAFIRAKLTWLRKSAYKDFVNVMRMMGLWDSNCMNKSDWEYTFDNGSQIFFIGLDQDAGFAKAHGLKTDIAFLNEITELGYEHVRQIDIRCTWLMLYDFNPNCPSDYWIYTRVLSQANAVHIHSTYKDNKWLERRIVETIESYEPTPENITRGTADETFWKIYGLGLQGIVKGLIFPNFRIVKDFPDKVEKPGYAMDFGFTNDPTTLLFCGQTPGNLWFDEMLYERDLVNLCVPNNPTIRSIEGELMRLHVRKNLPIYADSAEPKSIRDIQNAGFRMEAVTKGPGSVVAGIIAMKRFTINVTERSMNFITELQNYKWKDKTGSDGDAFVNEPVGAFDHLCDPARYYTVMCEPGSLITKSYADLMHVKVAGRASSKFDQFGAGDEEDERVTQEWARSLGCGANGFHDFGLSEQHNIPR